MSTPLLLALDQGTQSTRAVVFDPDGAVIDAAKVSIEPYFAARPGWAEQHPEVYWRAIREACQALWARGVQRERLVGVALSCQRGTPVCMDADCAPLRPAMVWLDLRRASVFPRLPLLYRLASLIPPVGRILRDVQEEAECNWLAQHEPELWARTARYGMLSAWLNFKLSGRFVDATASQVGYIPFDYKTQKWADPSHFYWSALCVRPSQLPEIVPAGGQLGAVTAAASADTGIPEGLPVFSAGSDKSCEALGAGVVTETVGSLSYGTTATFNMISKRYLEIVPLLPAFPAAVPGAWGVESAVLRGFWMVEWFKREFGHAEVAEGARDGIAPERLFERMLAETPPGNLGMTLQPYWSPAIRITGPEAKGAIIGWGASHGRAHMYRAIIEGIAYSLREARERLERRTGNTIHTLRATGGGAQSDGVMQITADIFGLPVERPKVLEASSLGAAINVAVGAGVYSDHEAAAAKMVQVGQRFEPRAEAAATCDSLYREVYKPMYGRLLPLYRSLHQITGARR